MCLITAVCVCVCACEFGPVEAWWKLEPYFALSAEFHSCVFLEAEGDVTDLVSLHLSASLWNLQPSALYRFCPSFLFTSCWDWNLKLRQRWSFRTARRNSDVSFKKIKKEVWDPDIGLYWKHTAGEHGCDVSGSLWCQLSLCNLFPSLSIFPIILSYD